MKRYPMMEWTPARVSKFWDYESQFPENYFTYQVGNTLIDRVARFLPAGGTVLDYGCGAGFLIRHLLDRGYRVAGVDFSQRSIEETNRKFSESKSYLGAFLPDEVLAKGMKFDVMFLLEVVEHLDDEHLDITLRNARSLLSDAGVLVVSTRNDEQLEKSHIFCPQCEEVFHRWQHVRSWTKESLAHQLAKYGLRVVWTLTTNLAIPLPPPEPKGVVPALKRVVKLALGIKPPPPPADAPNLVCVCSRA